VLFNSFEFLLFFPIVVSIAFLIPSRWRWLHLLIASYVFYMAWEPAYALLIFASTIVDYVVARQMERTDAPLRRRLLLSISLIVNLGLLFSFKYYNLINGTFVAAAAALGLNWPLPESNLLLPVGISFYTFQTLGYTIDVYWGKIKAERHFGRFALYVCFFPQLVAGPIERAQRLLPQFRKTHVWDTERVKSGLRLILWGLFKKVVVADRIALIADAIYGQPDAFGGLAVVIGTACFGYQVYCDFSGYSDIAIGTARVMGYDLMKNFDQPHLARSINAFWQRWHISLMSWFRDYIYIPLGGSRVSLWRMYLNIMAVFVASGIWHGAEWSFVVWGAMNGVYIVVGMQTAALRDRLAERTGFAQFPRVRAVWQVGSTVGITYFSFVFFRAETIPHALSVYARLLHGWTDVLTPGAFTAFADALGMEAVMVAFCLALLPLTEMMEYAQRHKATWQIPTWAQWVSDYALFFSVVALGRFSSDAFFYFQF
jgi:D-alanyl-lipoteichoic acid acyltransferase DltB (MBOAT superfamily)